MEDPATARDRGALEVASTCQAAGVAVFAASLTAADPDLWGHVRFGLATLAHGLERVDPYSFTATGAAWVNHEWATEVAMALVWRTAGSTGLLAAKLVLAVATLWLVVAACRVVRSAPLAEVVVIPLVALAMSPGYLTRPQVVSFTLFAVLMLLVSRAAAGGTVALLGLPPVMALWANLHGGFLMGGATLAVAVLAITVTAIRRRTLRSELGWWWAVAAVAAAATLVTPYGPGLHRFLLASVPVPRPIGEWAPLPLTDTSFPAVKLVLVAVVVAALVRWRRTPPWQLAVVALTVVMTLRHQRNAPFMAMAAAPVLVAALAAVWDRLPGLELSRRVTRPVAVAVAGASVLWAAAGTVRLAGDRFEIAVDPFTYPVAAVQVVREAGLAGRLVVPFEWGEYAIWHLWPACRVSVDGRFRTVYPEPVLEAHYRAHLEPSRWLPLASELGGELLLVRSHPEVTDALTRSRDWTPVHRDPVATLAVATDRVTAAIVQAARAASRRTALPVEATFP